MVIFEEATKEAFDYYSYELPAQSHKHILASCDNCGKVRKISKNVYRALCRSCSMNGKTHTEETIALISAALKGEKNPMFGKHPWNFGKPRTEETKAKQSAAVKGKYVGENNPNYGKRDKDAAGYRGGKKLANARSRAKRRQLGLILLNSYFEDCEGHHITHNFVIYLPSALHKSVYHNLNTGQGMEVINTLALDFLVNGF